LTYGQIAQKIGNPKAVRAVGGACHNNPIGIVIPCHRVLGKDGSLTGYAGGVHLKEMLLKHEKKA
jgi:methylated-DNA-[protein]-cysteine S-methyltransferase